MGFWRDHSGRLTFDWPGVAAADYPVVCQGIADSLGLTPAGEIIVGPDQLFREFARGGQVVGMYWDIWFEFMAVALSPASNPLVHEIAAWLGSRPDAPGTSSDDHNNAS